jgi:hypothetical protein
MHAIYKMVGTDLDPVGAGDTKSWFHFYKWGKGKGDTYVPLDVSIEELPGVGDILWFVLDDIVQGYVTVTSVSTTLSTGRTEVWYDTETAVILDEPARFSVSSDQRRYWRQDAPLVPLLVFVLAT